MRPLRYRQGVNCVGGSRHFPGDMQVLLGLPDFILHVITTMIDLVTLPEADQPHLMLTVKGEGQVGWRDLQQAHTV